MLYKNVPYHYKNAFIVVILKCQCQCQCCSVSAQATPQLLQGVISSNTAVTSGGHLKQHCSYFSGSSQATPQLLQGVISSNTAVTSGVSSGCLCSIFKNYFIGGLACISLSIVHLCTFQKNISNHSLYDGERGTKSHSAAILLACDRHSMKTRIFSWICTHGSIYHIQPIKRTCPN